MLQTCDQILDQLNQPQNDLQGDFFLIEEITKMSKLIKDSNELEEIKDAHKKFEELYQKTDETIKNCVSQDRIKMLKNLANDIKALVLEKKYSQLKQDRDEVLKKIIKEPMVVKYHVLRNDSKYMQTVNDYYKDQQKQIDKKNNKQKHKKKTANTQTNIKSEDYSSTFDEILYKKLEKAECEKRKKTDLLKDEENIFFLNRELAKLENEKSALYTENGQIESRIDFLKKEHESAELVKGRELAKQKVAEEARRYKEEKVKAKKEKLVGEKMQEDQRLAQQRQKEKDIFVSEVEERSEFATKDAVNKYFSACFSFAVSSIQKKQTQKALNELVKNIDLESNLGQKKLIQNIELSGASDESIEKFKNAVLCFNERAKIVKQFINYLIKEHEIDVLQQAGQIMCDKDWGGILF
jgi:hypothetical protein